MNYTDSESPQFTGYLLTKLYDEMWRIFHDSVYPSQRQQPAFHSDEVLPGELYELYDTSHPDISRHIQRTEHQNFKNWKTLLREVANPLTKSQVLAMKSVQLNFEDFDLSGFVKLVPFQKILAIFIVRSLCGSKWYLSTPCVCAIMIHGRSMVVWCSSW